MVANDTKIFVINVINRGWLSIGKNVIRYEKIRQLYK